MAPSTACLMLLILPKMLLSNYWLLFLGCWNLLVSCSQLDMTDTYYPGLAMLACSGQFHSQSDFYVQTESVGTYIVSNTTFSSRNTPNNNIHSKSAPLRLLCQQASIPLFSVPATDETRALGLIQSTVLDITAHKVHEVLQNAVEPAQRLVLDITIHLQTGHLYNAVGPSGGLVLDNTIHLQTGHVYSIEPALGLVPDNTIYLKPGHRELRGMVLEITMSTTCVECCDILRYSVCKTVALLRAFALRSFMMRHDFIALLHQMSEREYIHVSKPSIFSQPEAAQEKPVLEVLYHP